VSRAGEGGSSTRRRLLVATAVVVVVAVATAAAWWLRGRSGDAAAAPGQGTTVARVVDVTTGTIADTVSADGTVAAATTDELSFTSAGTVTAVEVKAGDTVTTGEVLATIDPTALQAAMGEANANKAAADATLADDQAAGASADQITADQSKVAVAQDAVVKAYEALAGAPLTSTIDGTVSSVDLTVGEELGSSGAGATTLTGSGSGSGSSSAAVGSGNGAQGSGGGSGASTPAAQIVVVSTGHYTVDLAVDSNDIATVKAGQPVTLSVSTTTGSDGLVGLPGSLAGGGAALPGGFAGRLAAGAAGAAGRNQSSAAAQPAQRAGGRSATATGTVSAVSPVADASSGVASFAVTVAFDDTSGQFLVGTAVTGAITTQQRPDVVEVPTLAVTTAGGTSSVLVSKDGSTTGTERRTVTTGATAGGMVEITSGLQAGEQVVVEVPSFAGGRGTGAGGTGNGFGTGGRFGEGGGTRFGAGGNGGGRTAGP
jgi:multidrug efflux pump subunit AcrA (membrane-fusion protein)